MIGEIARTLRIHRVFSFRLRFKGDLRYRAFELEGLEGFV
jgi:hypothetical protein